MSSSPRPVSLAPQVRSEAAIAESGEIPGQPSRTEGLVLPGAVCAPTGGAPASVFPPRQSNHSSSVSTDAGSLPIPYNVTYKFTLVDLNARSYYLIHEETTAWTESDKLNELRDHMRQAVVLANLEVCLIRNWNLAGRRQDDGAIDLTLEPRNAAADKRRGKEHDRALEPVVKLLPKRLTHVSRREVSRLLDAQVRKAMQLLEECGDELANVDGKKLRELAYTLAAYQPAVLDEEIKGSQSPYDPRSHTDGIGYVQELVEWSAKKGGTHAPEALAKLAMRMLGAVRLAPLAELLLQGAFSSGHSELVAKLLDRSSSSSLELNEERIIICLRKAWLGYQRSYRPLQSLRVGPKAHSIDWLDFKCSCARAVLIAHKVIETLILRDQHDLTQALHRATTGAAKAEADAGRPPLPAAEPLGDAAAAASDPSTGQPIAAANDGDASQQSKPPDVTGAAGGRQGTGRVVIGEAPEADAVSPPGSVVTVAYPSTTAQCRLPGCAPAHVELEDSKWALVRELFSRPAACKPLALAMLHVVLAGKVEVQRAAAKLKVKAEGGGGGDELSPPEAAGSGDGEEQAEGEVAAQAREADEEKVSPYQKLHLLAVQACHLAVHSGSLSAVSDAISCIRAVQAWPEINMGMLNDLAEAFPYQCAALLEAIPLQEVDLEDNVLPFGLPPGFTTVAVSDKNAGHFLKGGGTGSTQDAEHFATQREADASIEASLLVLARTWLALLFLFWPAEFASPTTHHMLRVLHGAVAAFLWQGPGSCVVAVVFAALLLVAGIVTRAVVVVVRILYYGILYRIWGFVVARFPGLRSFVNRILGRSEGPRANRPLTWLSSLATARRQADASAGEVVGGGEDEGTAAEDDDEEEPEGLTRQLGMGLWRKIFAHGHNALIDGAVGWGKGSASISCRKLPMTMEYASRSGPDAGSGPPGAHQLDTALLEKLLKVPGLHPSVFGSKVLRALILFKWNYFTKYFIILQLLLHITYMAVFLVYAFSIKDMEPVDGRESGPGANTPGCLLQAPTTTQTVLLIVLGVMTVDFLVQELRQIRHFGMQFLTHTWDLLDVCSVALVVASVTLHLTCTSGASPLTLRGLAAVQIVLLFMRLLYFAMASDKLGSFVRMVLETAYDLGMFFAFLSVVFVGFGLAIIVSQGSLAEEGQIFIKLFTMMYGDFDVAFLSSLESGALGLDGLTRVLASIYMILVTIILLNLIISVISESYERIRENEKWESLRNKALLVVESETQLYQHFLTWLYTTLTPPSQDHNKDNGKRYLYVIAPEYARNTEAGGDGEEEYGAEEEVDDGQWNGRLGEIKRHVSAQARATVDVMRKELHKAVDSVQAANGNAAAPPSDIALAGAAAAAGGVVGTPAGTAGEEVPAREGHPALSPGREASPLDERTVQLLATQVGALSQQLVEMRQELLAEISKAGTSSQQQQQQQQQQGYGGRLLAGGNTARLLPLAGGNTAMGSLPPLAGANTTRGSLPPLPTAGYR